MRSRPSMLHIAWFLLALGLAVSGIPHRDGGTPERPDLDGGRDRWIVKLSEGRGLVLDDQARLLQGAGSESRAWGALADRVPGAEIERLFPRPREELVRYRKSGEERTGRRLRDLSLYARITVPRGTHVDLPRELRAALEDPDWLEFAYPEPIAEPAFVELWTDQADESGASGGGTDGRAPDFLRGQGYLEPSPNGIGALAVHRYPGGRGASVRIVDVEGDWNWNHQDLSAPFLMEGSTIPAWRNHGTAVVGQLVGRDDGHGIVGICPDAEIGAVSFLDFGVAAAIDLAAASVEPGDIVLIELHAPGPAEPEGPGQFGYLPMEWWQDCFDAIEIATANGRIVVEAAGNGSQDLDHPRYLGLFDRNVRNSGALLVGAGTPWEHGAEWFTNRGARIDLNGWGSAIITTGYGTLWEGRGESQWYTAGFGGTSGAAPMIAGAVACLQSMSRSLWRVDLDPGLALELLRETGTPCAPGAKVGPRPDLVAARRALVHGIADLRGQVLDSDGSPVPSALVALHPGNRSVSTDENGAFRIPVRAPILGLGENLDATVSVHADGFLPASASLDLHAGDYRRRNFVLQPTPRSLCRGRVPTQDGLAVAGMSVRAISRPGRDNAPVHVYDARTDEDGAYELTALPRNADYSVVAGPVPGTAVAPYHLALAANAPPIVDIPELVAVAAETFESGDAGWSGGSPWRSSSEAAFSGTRGWFLGDPYVANLDVALVSPSLQLSANSWLGFHHRFETEPGYDGGRIEIESQGVWMPLSPLEGYDVPNVAALHWGPGYSGWSNGWQTALVDLSAWAGSEVRIRFRFASDESLSGSGWWIDDIAVFSGNPEPSSVPDELAGEPSDGSGAPPTLELRAYPNPFREQVRLECRGAAPGGASPFGGPEGGTLRVVDTAGRSIARLPLGDGMAVWEGRDQAGRAVPNGVYWVVLVPGDEVTSDVRRVGGTNPAGTGTSSSRSHGALPVPLKVLRLQ